MCRQPGIVDHGNDGTHDRGGGRRSKDKDKLAINTGKFKEVDTSIRLITLKNTIKDDARDDIVGSVVKENG